VPKHSFYFEIDADRGYESRRETVVGVPKQERSLPNATVADDEQLEHVIKVLVGPFLLPFTVLPGHFCSTPDKKTFIAVTQTGRQTCRREKATRYRYVKTTRTVWDSYIVRCDLPRAKLDGDYTIERRVGECS